MTPAGPLGAATPVAGGLPAGGGTAPAAGAGQDFLALVLQMLGQAPSDPAAPATTDGTTDGTTEPAVEPPAGGASASVPDAPTVAGTPLPGQEAPDEDEATDEPSSGAGDPATLAALPLALLQAVVAARAPAAPAAASPATSPAIDPAIDPATSTPGTDTAPANDVASAHTASAAGTPPTPDPTAQAPGAPAPVPAPATAPATGSMTPVAAPTTLTAVPTQAAPAPAPVTHQVFDEIMRVSGTGTGPRRVTVRLQPEALGEVRVVLSVRDGSLRVSLAAGGAAHHTLLAGAPELQRLLEAAGSPDARIVVRDLPPAAPATAAASASSTAVPGPGQGSAPDLGTGLGAGQAGSGQTPERRTPHGGSNAMDGINDPADPPRRTESVTRTRTAGVDVTM